MKKTLTLGDVPTHVFGENVLAFLVFDNDTPHGTLQSLVDPEMDLWNLNVVFSRHVPETFTWNRVKDLELHAVPYAQIMRVFNDRAFPYLERLLLHPLGEGKKSVFPVEEPIYTKRFWSGLARNIVYGRPEIQKFGELRFKYMPALKDLRIDGCSEHEADALNDAIEAGVMPQLERLHVMGSLRHGVYPDFTAGHNMYWDTGAPNLTSLTIIGGAVTNDFFSLNDFNQLEYLELQHVKNVDFSSATQKPNLREAKISDLRKAKVLGLFDQRRFPALRFLYLKRTVTRAAPGRTSGLVVLMLKGVAGRRPDTFSSSNAAVFGNVTFPNLVMLSLRCADDAKDAVVSTNAWNVMPALSQIVLSTNLRVDFVHFPSGVPITVYYPEARNPPFEFGPTAQTSPHLADSEFLAVRRSFLGPTSEAIAPRGVARMPPWLADKVRVVDRADIERDGITLLRVGTRAAATAVTASALSGVWNLFAERMSGMAQLRRMRAEHPSRLAEAEQARFLPATSSRPIAKRTDMTAGTPWVVSGMGLREKIAAAARAYSKGSRIGFLRFLRKTATAFLRSSVPVGVARDLLLDFSDPLALAQKILSDGRYKDGFADALYSAPDPISFEVSEMSHVVGVHRSRYREYLDLLKGIRTKSGVLSILPQVGSVLGQIFVASSIAMIGGLVGNLVTRTISRWASPANERVIETRMIGARGSGGHRLAVPIVADGATFRSDGHGILRASFPRPGVMRINDLTVPNDAEHMLGDYPIRFVESVLDRARSEHNVHRVELTMHPSDFLFGLMNFSGLFDVGDRSSVLERDLLRAPPFAQFGEEGAPMGARLGERERVRLAKLRTQMGTVPHGDIDALIDDAVMRKLDRRRLMRIQNTAHATAAYNDLFGRRAKYAKQRNLPQPYRDLQTFKEYVTLYLVENKDRLLPLKTARDRRKKRLRDTPVAQDLPPMPRVLGGGRWLLSQTPDGPLSMLGGTQFGSVYEARDRQLNTSVAIKRMDMRKLSKAVAFHQQLMNYRRLSGSPHVVGLIDAFRDREVPVAAYFVFELFHDTLADVVGRYANRRAAFLREERGIERREDVPHGLAAGYMPNGLKKDIMRRVLEAAKFVHGQGAVHYNLRLDSWLVMYKDPAVKDREPFDLGPGDIVRIAAYDFSLSAVLDIAWRQPRNTGLSTGMNLFALPAGAAAVATPFFATSPVVSLAVPIVAGAFSLMRAIMRWKYAGYYRLYSPEIEDTKTIHSPSPELVKRNSPSVNWWSVDVWALGVMFVELQTMGWEPFKSKGRLERGAMWDVRLRGGKLPVQPGLHVDDRSTLRDMLVKGFGLPVEFAQMAERMLNRNPRKRPSPNALLQEKYLQ